MRKLNRFLFIAKSKYYALHNNHPVNTMQGLYYLCVYIIRCGMTDFWYR